MKINDFGDGVKNHLRDVYTIIKLEKNGKKWYNICDVSNLHLTKEEYNYVQRQQNYRKNEKRGKN